MNSNKARLKSSNAWKISYVARGDKPNAKRGNPKARGGKPIDERKARGKKINMWVELSEKKPLNDQRKKMFQQLSLELFGN